MIVVPQYSPDAQLTGIAVDNNKKHGGNTNNVYGAAHEEENEKESNTFLLSSSSSASSYSSSSTSRSSDSNGDESLEGGENHQSLMTFEDYALLCDQVAAREASLTRNCATETPTGFFFDPSGGESVVEREIGIMGDSAGMMMREDGGIVQTDRDPVVDPGAEYRVALVNKSSRRRCRSIVSQSQQQQQGAGTTIRGQQGMITEPNNYQYLEGIDDQPKRYYSILPPYSPPSSPRDRGDVAMSRKQGAEADDDIVSSGDEDGTTTRMRLHAQRKAEAEVQQMFLQKEEEGSPSAHGVFTSTSSPVVRDRRGADIDMDEDGEEEGDEEDLLDTWAEDHDHRVAAMIDDQLNRILDDEAEVLLERSRRKPQHKNSSGRDAALEEEVFVEGQDEEEDDELGTTDSRRKLLFSTSPSPNSRGGGGGGLIGASSSSSPHYRVSSGQHIYSHESMLSPPKFPPGQKGDGGLTSSSSSPPPLPNVPPPPSGVHAPPSKKEANSTTVLPPPPMNRPGKKGQQQTTTGGDETGPPVDVEGVEEMGGSPPTPSPMKRMSEGSPSPGSQPPVVHHKKSPPRHKPHPTESSTTTPPLPSASPPQISGSLESPVVGDRETEGRGGEEGVTDSPGRKKKAPPVGRGRGQKSPSISNNVNIEGGAPRVLSSSTMGSEVGGRDDDDDDRSGTRAPSPPASRPTSSGNGNKSPIRTVLASSSPTRRIPSPPSTRPPSVPEQENQPENSHHREQDMTAAGTRSAGSPPHQIRAVSKSPPRTKPIPRQQRDGEKAEDGLSKKSPSPPRLPPKKRPLRPPAATTDGVVVAEQEEDGPVVPPTGGTSTSKANHHGPKTPPRKIPAASPPESSTAGQASKHPSPPKFAKLHKTKNQKRHVSEALTLEYPPPSPPKTRVAAAAGGQKTVSNDANDKKIIENIPTNKQLNAALSRYADDVLDFLDRLKDVGHAKLPLDCMASVRSVLTMALSISKAVYETVLSAKNARRGSEEAEEKDDLVFASDDALRALSSAASGAEMASGSMYAELLVSMEEELALLSRSLAFQKTGISIRKDVCGELFSRSMLPPKDLANGSRSASPMELLMADTTTKVSLPARSIGLLSESASHLQQEREELMDLRKRAIFTEICYSFLVELEERFPDGYMSVSAFKESSTSSGSSDDEDAESQSLTMMDVLSNAGMQILSLCSGGGSQRGSSAATNGGDHLANTPLGHKITEKSRFKNPDGILLESEIINKLKKSSSAHIALSKMLIKVMEILKIDTLRSSHLMPAPFNVGAFLENNDLIPEQFMSDIERTHVHPERYEKLENFVHISTVRQDTFQQMLDHGKNYNKQLEALVERMIRYFSILQLKDTIGKSLTKNRDASLRKDDQLPLTQRGKSQLRIATTVWETTLKNIFVETTHIEEQVSANAAFLAYRRRCFNVLVNEVELLRKLDQVSLLIPADLLFPDLAAVAGGEMEYLPRERVNDVQERLRRQQELVNAVASANGALVKSALILTGNMLLRQNEDDHLRKTTGTERHQDRQHASSHHEHHSAEEEMRIRDLLKQLKTVQRDQDRIGSISFQSRRFIIRRHSMKLAGAGTSANGKGIKENGEGMDMEELSPSFTPIELRRVLSTTDFVALERVGSFHSPICTSPKKLGESTIPVEFAAGANSSFAILRKGADHMLMNTSGGSFTGGSAAADEEEENGEDVEQSRLDLSFAQLRELEMSIPTTESFILAEDNDDEEDSLLNHQHHHRRSCPPAAVQLFGPLSAPMAPIEAQLILSSLRVLLNPGVLVSVLFKNTVFGTGKDEKEDRVAPMVKPSTMSLSGDLQSVLFIAHDGAGEDDVDDEEDTDDKTRDKKKKKKKKSKKNKKKRKGPCGAVYDETDAFAVINLRTLSRSISGGIRRGEDQLLGISEVPSLVFDIPEYEDRPPVVLFLSKAAFQEWFGLLELLVSQVLMMTNKHQTDADEESPIRYLQGHLS